MKKSKTRLYVDKELSSNIMIYIRDKQHHFLKNVLRIKIQDTIIVFDGISGEWLSKVVSINRNNIVLQILQKNKKLDSEVDLWLIFAPIKSLRMNITIQKATELGVSAIIPCITQNTNQPKINIRNLKMNIIEAAEQSERLTLPKLEKTITLNDLLDKFPRDRGLIFCDENNEDLPSINETLPNYTNTYKKWAVLIGPEGGFTEIEIKKIASISSSIPVSLGKRILRSDTATTAALFSIQSIIEKQ